MVLDRKSPDFGPTLLNIRYGILVFVIHDISAVIADAQPVIADFIHDSSAIPAGGRVASVLFNQNGDATGAGHRRHPLELSQKQVALAWSRFPQRPQEP